MKISVIRDDKTVYIDGVVTHNVNLSFLPPNIHAIQWDDISGKGHAEFDDKPNEAIEVFDYRDQIISAIDAADKVNADAQYKAQEQRELDEAKAIADAKAAQLEKMKNWTRKIDVVSPSEGKDPDFTDKPSDDVIPAISLVSNLWVKQMLFQKAGDCHPGHRHNFDHQTLLAKGSVEVNVNGEKTDFKAPTIIFIKAGLRHGMVALEDETIVYCVHPLRDGEQTSDIIAPENVPKGVWPLIQDQPQKPTPVEYL